MAATVVPFPRKFAQPTYVEPFEAEYLALMALPDPSSLGRSIRTALGLTAPAPPAECQQVQKLGETG